MRIIDKPVHCLFCQFMSLSFWIMFFAVLLQHEFIFSYVPHSFTYILKIKHSTLTMEATILFLYLGFPCIVMASTKRYRLFYIIGYTFFDYGHLFTFLQCHCVVATTFVFFLGNLWEPPSRCVIIRASFCNFCNFCNFFLQLPTAA